MYYWCAHCQKYKTNHNTHTCTYHKPETAAPCDRVANQYEEAHDDNVINRVDKHNEDIKVLNTQGSNYMTK